MKPQTISTLEGIFTLDRDGFYIPYEEPEPRPVPLIIIWVPLLIASWGVAAGFWMLSADGRKGGGGMSEYDPADDAVKSYYAAIEAKRARGDALRPIRYARSRGLTLSQMRENIPSNLRNAGDAILLWVNEGDFWMNAPVIEVTDD